MDRICPDYFTLDILLMRIFPMGVSAYINSSLEHGSYFSSKKLYRDISASLVLSQCLFPFSINQSALWDDLWEILTKSFKYLNICSIYQNLVQVFHHFVNISIKRFLVFFSYDATRLRRVAHFELAVRAISIYALCNVFAIGQSDMRYLFITILWEFTINVNIHYLIISNYIHCREAISEAQILQ